MTDQEYTIKRLEEYKEYTSKVTRFKTMEEFKEFTSKNFCYYDTGFGAYIQALITTDAEFIDFMLKCGNITYGEDNFPYFINDYRHNDQNNHIFFAEEPDEDSDAERWYSDGEFAGTMPSVAIAGYRVEYNRFFDEPFEVWRNDEFKTYPEGTFRVNPKTSARFPAIVRFVSIDDFDRTGTIKGDALTIISLADVADKKMMMV